MSMDLRRDRHSVSSLKIHLIYVTKSRRKILSKSLELIEKIFKKVSDDKGFKILEFNGEADHIHTLLEYPPKLSVSQIVNSLKGVSSRFYGKAQFPKPYGKDALWSPSYFVSSVGEVPLEILKTYIQKQEKPS